MAVHKKFGSSNPNNPNATFAISMGINNVNPSQSK